MSYTPNNALILQSDRTILLEVHSLKAEVGREAIAPMNCKREDAEVGRDRILSIQPLLS